MEPATVTIISTICLITMTTLITGRYFLEFGTWLKEEINDISDKRYFKILVNRDTLSERFIGILLWISKQNLDKFINTTSVLINADQKSKYVLIPTVGEEYWTNAPGFGKIGIITLGNSEGTITGFQVKSRNKQNLLNFLNHVQNISDKKNI